MPTSPVGLSITSDPDTTRIETGTAARPRAKTEVPRIVLVADLDPQGTEARGVETADRNGFGAWMKGWAPRLEVSVENEMGGAERVQAVLVADSLDAFLARRLARDVPALARLAGTRQALAEHRAGRLDADALRKRFDDAGVPTEQSAALLEALTRPAADDSAGDASTGSAIDRILGLVGNGQAPSAPSPAANLLDQPRRRRRRTRRRRAQPRRRRAPRRPRPPPRCPTRRHPEPP